ncbi:MAG: YvcK family protein [Actinomycetota bacterium]|jgi:2-phospho-L-lactate transferase/gluconeogenesis factor (CofD/UPF0052 family)|nr:YvcK family protein [Actinomycetota bacterium]
MTGTPGHATARPFVEASHRGAPTEPPGPDRRPRVVAVGGGHGLAATLRAVRRYAGTVTALVSVADDGGSSGRLRRQLGVVPPGDLRKCLVALAEPGSLLAAAFAQRFGADGLAGPADDGAAGPVDAGGTGPGPSGGAAGGGDLADGGREGAGPRDLDGHALGNLVLVGLMQAAGDPIAGLDEAGRLLGVRGRVLPTTTACVVLRADTSGGVVEGQVAVMASRSIARVSLVPPAPPAPRCALEALAAADQIVIGPGSLYTSVLAATAVPEVATAIRSSRATKVYVSNLREQVPETEGYDVARHLDALADHGVPVDVVVYDGRTIDRGPLRHRAIETALARPNGRAHDPELLADVLNALSVESPRLDI